MLTIIHGDNLIQSRQKLSSIMSEAKSNQFQVTILNANHLTPNLLEENLLSQNLFEQKQLLVIEELHSLTKSKKNHTLINQIALSKENICLWEKKLLTPKMLKTFPHAQVFCFKVTNQLFQWLDSLTPTINQRQLKLLQQAIKDNGDWFCLAMLIRQIRLLIQIKDQHPIKAAPFMIQKLKQQASKFDFDQLLHIHSALLQLDIHHKTSKNYLPLEKELNTTLLKLEIKN